MSSSNPESTTRPASAAAAVPPRRRTILVVDDDAACCRVLAEMLRDAGYDAIEACDFTLALDVLDDTSQTIDLLLTDVKMPVHGFALARMAHQRRPLLRILYVTGYPDLAQEETPEPGSKLLLKPIRQDTLAAAVDASLTAVA